MLERSAFRRIGVIHRPHLAVSRIEVELTAFNGLGMSLLVQNVEPTMCSKCALWGSRPTLRTAIANLRRSEMLTQVSCTGGLVRGFEELAEMTVRHVSPMENGSGD